jgi:hypothetical protein
MVANNVLEQFSRNRLDGEPVPGDLRILLPHRDELAERTSIRLEWAEDWAPWQDANFLIDAEPLGRDSTPNVRAIKDVCRHIAFVGADQAGQLFGYWRGPSHRKVEESPLVILDDKRHFHLCIASNFAEAILARAYGREHFTKLRAWLRALGISIDWQSPDQLTIPYEVSTPKDLHRELFERYRMEPAATRQSSVGSGTDSQPG